MARRDKHNYYLDIAEAVLQRGTCLKRNFGSVIVRNDEIISTGYNGAPRRRKNCLDLGFASGTERIFRGTRCMRCAVPSTVR